ncbi:hypothetical protein ACLMAJ_36725 [Nocardia sp. KC 131]|uniref:hypothetical protein n=1 Tax=Nocardia arseniciresistens TaxID=3392119 RepID=UPI00398EEBD7
MTFTSALRTAMDTTDGIAYIDRVKAVVRSQLQELDSTAKIEDTLYYNHSAIPDFVLSWPGERGKRRVYLRDSYSSILAGDDTSYLKKLEPVLLALDSADGAQEVEQINLRTSPGASARTLVTDVDAVEVIAGGESPASSSPLNSLVRANFVRGGRGYVDHDRAERLVEGPETMSPDRLDDIAGLISENFVEDAAARITRTAQLIEFALRGRPNDVESWSVVGGRLSLAEIRHLLPWLLAQPEAAENGAFWRYVGSLMTFDELEQIRESIADIDVSPLIRANSDVWEANWAYLGASRAVDHNDVDPRDARWSFDSGRLGVDLGMQRIIIAKNGRLIRARENLSAASWDELRVALSRYQLASISLRGIRRSIVVDAVESTDVRQDVEDISNSVEDRYYVSGTTVRVPSRTAEDGYTDLVVDFGGSVVHAQGGATIQDLTEIALLVLNYRSTIPSGDLGRVIGSSSHDT